MNILFLLALIIPKVASEQDHRSCPSGLAKPNSAATFGMMSASKNKIFILIIIEII